MFLGNSLTLHWVYTGLFSCFALIIVLLLLTFFYSLYVAIGSVYAVKLWTSFIRSPTTSTTRLVNDACSSLSNKKLHLLLDIVCLIFLQLDYPNSEAILKCAIW